VTLKERLKSRAEAASSVMDRDRLREQYTKKNSLKAQMCASKYTTLTTLQYMCFWAWICCLRTGVLAVQNHGQFLQAHVANLEQIIGSPIALYDQSAFD
jgi:roadblock/LC7 domain-containing protein